VGEELRTPEVSRASSQVALLHEVRLWVTDRLRAWGAQGGVVAEGRDQGSVVFPQAQVKFYLDAALEVRAQRRLMDWRRDGNPPALDQVRQDLADRDRQDATRKEGPLKVPAGAIRLDTTGMSLEEVVNQCLARIREHLEPGGMENKENKPF
jgi:cytidylate kinase